MDKLQRIMEDHLLEFYRLRTGLVDWEWDDEDDERKPPINIQVIRDWGDYLVGLGCQYEWNRSGIWRTFLDVECEKFDHPYYLRWNRRRLIRVPKELVIKILTLGGLPTEDENGHGHILRNF